MNKANKKFLEEARMLEERWAKTGLVSFGESRDEHNVRILLESQRLENEKRYVYGLVKKEKLCSCWSCELCMYEKPTSSMLRSQTLAEMMESQK